VGLGVGGAISAWLGGYIYDIFGDYALMIVLVMLAILIGNIGIWFVAPRTLRV
jgi:hypothetical protein